MRNATKSVIAVAAAMLATGAVAPQPAAAQGQASQSREPYDSGPYGGPYGWSGQTASERLDHLGSDIDDLDRYSREQFRRGYRAGRQDERRMSAGRGDERRAGRTEDQDHYYAAIEFLDYAQRQMDRGDLRGAWAALGRAETRLATRALPEGADDEAAAGGAVGAIRAARRALRDRDMDLAQARTARAMDLAQRGVAVARNVPGATLAGAGVPGPAEPFARGGRGNGSRGGAERDD
jgi:hypothetical protein